MGSQDKQNKTEIINTNLKATQTMITKSYVDGFVDKDELVRITERFESDKSKIQAETKNQILNVLTDVQEKINFLTKEILKTGVNIEINNTLDQKLLVLIGNLGYDLNKIRSNIFRNNPEGKPIFLKTNAKGGIDFSPYDDSRGSKGFRVSQINSDLAKTVIGNTDTYLQNGDNFLAVKDYKEALKYYNEAYKNDQKNPNILAKLANYYSVCGDTKVAEEYYTKAIKLNSTKPEYFQARCQLYLKTEKYNSAIEDYDKFSELNGVNKELDAQISKIKQSRDEIRKLFPQNNEYLSKKPSEIDNKFNGKATVEYDGSIYQGEFVNGECEGNGKVFFFDGTKYEGKLKSRYFNGKGIYTWSDGTKYEGDWKAGKKDGKGIYTNKNGVKFTGNWKDDLFTGKVGNENRTNESIDNLDEIGSSGKIEVEYDNEKADKKTEGKKNGEKEAKTDEKKEIGDKKTKTEPSQKTQKEKAPFSSEKFLENHADEIGDLLNEIEKKDSAKGGKLKTLFEYDNKGITINLDKEKIEEIQTFIGMKKKSKKLEEKADGKFGINTLKKLGKFNESLQSSTKEGTVETPLEKAKKDFEAKIKELNELIKDDNKKLSDIKNIDKKIADKIKTIKADELSEDQIKTISTELDTLVSERKAKLVEMDKKGEALPSKSDSKNKETGKTPEVFNEKEIRKDIDLLRSGNFGNTMFSGEYKSFASELEEILNKGIKETRTNKDGSIQEVRVPVKNLDQIKNYLKTDPNYKINSAAQDYLKYKN